MIKGRIFFHPIDGSGSLTISWSSRPKGDAVEAQKGNGVGFFSERGRLLAVIFDEVLEKKDHQILEFKRQRIEISIQDGKVSYRIVSKEPAPRQIKRRSSIGTRRRKSSVK